MKKYLVTRTNWYNTTYYTEGQDAYFDDDVNPPSHFEFVSVVGRPRVEAKNKKKTKADFVPDFED